MSPTPLPCSTQTASPQHPVSEFGGRVSEDLQLVDKPLQTFPPSTKSYFEVVKPSKSKRTFTRIYAKQNQLIFVENGPKSSQKDEEVQE